MHIPVILTPCGGSFLLLWMLILPQVEAQNCALDTRWQIEGVRKTLQGWLDAQEKGNVTGQTGDYIWATNFRLLSGILWSWAGVRWQDGYFYSEEGESRDQISISQEEGETKPNFN